MVEGHQCAKKKTSGRYPRQMRRLQCKSRKILDQRYYSRRFRYVRLQAERVYWKHAVFSQAAKHVAQLANSPMDKVFAATQLHHRKSSWYFTHTGTVMQHSLWCAPRTTLPSGTKALWLIHVIPRLRRESLRPRFDGFGQFTDRIG